MIIVLVSGAAFFAGSMMKKGGGVLNNANLKLAGEVIGNPVVTYLTLEGKVTAVDQEMMTLEKDGKQLKAYISPDSTFTKMDSPEKLAGGTPSAATAISELPLGSEVIGGATIQKDAKSSEYKIYTTNFWVK